MNEGNSTTVYATYIAACPGCGLPAKWLSWADQNAAAIDRALYLRVDCESCESRQRVVA